ncbi:hypothetical protein MVEG_07443 [Podila verticillata NRRL 6337]|nr:hypothetical protein MVEG_07443 [Podila verticillata NRRL 6337]
MNSVGPLNLSSSPEPSSFSPTGSGRTHSGSSLSRSIYNTRLAATLPVESRFGSATSRFTSDVVAFLNRIGDRLPERWRPYFWPGLWFGFVALVIGLLAGFHSKIFEALESIATFIKNLGPLGPPVIMTALFIASFPPMVGYSSIVTMSGYVYGFSFGFFIAYTSAFVGAMVCFYCCRRWFKAQARNLINKNQSLKSAVRAVEKRGFKLLFLIRLAPYPYNVLNLALSLTHIPIMTFAAATALSLLKLSLHVYIGSTLSTLTTPKDGDDTPDPNAGSKPLRIFVLVAGIILGVIVGAYVGLLAKHEIDQSENARLEQLRRRRARQRRQNDTFGSLDARDEHGGSGDYVPSVDLTNQRPGSDYVGGNYLDEDEDDEYQTLFQQSSNPWDRDNAYNEDDDDDDMDGPLSDSEDSVLFDEDEEFDDGPDLERGAGGAGIELSQSRITSGTSSTHNFFGDDEQEHGVDISDNRRL